MTRYLLLAFSLLMTHLTIAQFNLIGDAKYMTGDCIQLTPDVAYSEGIAYHQTKLNLERFFEIEFDIYLGSKDEGADGITFVIHNDPRGFNAFGTYGECMGYGRWRKDYLGGNYISPSIAIEFDTYQNFQQNDPSSDHAAYLEGGTNFHPNFWNNDNANYNLEDDRMHNFRFRWNPRTQQIKVTLDGNTVYEGKRDLVNEVFGGQTKVIWGFTASTGRKFNLQYFCLKSWVLDEESQKIKQATQN
ncbi:MAG: L-type lectin-domain containing protein [Flammeovirgaceae bacterium]